jgi:hypothetical protein
MNQIVCIKKLRNLTGKGMLSIFHNIMKHKQVNKQVVINYILEKLRNFNRKLSVVFHFYLYDRSSGM